MTYIAIAKTQLDPPCNVGRGNIQSSMMMTLILLFIALKGKNERKVMKKETKRVRHSAEVKKTQLQSAKVGVSW